MFQTSLFVLFPVSEAFEKMLQGTNPSLVAMFTQGGDDYLESVEHNGQHYLGKCAGDTADIARITLLEANIGSLLRRLVPDYPYQETPLVVLAKPTK